MKSKLAISSFILMIFGFLFLAYSFLELYLNIYLFGIERGYFSILLVLWFIPFIIFFSIVTGAMSIYFIKKKDLEGKIYCIISLAGNLILLLLDFYIIIEMS